MLTKKEFELIFEMNRHDGNITFKEQRCYTNMKSFYEAIGNIKRHGLIIIIFNDDDNRRHMYELTLKGVELCKLLNG